MAPLVPDSDTHTVDNADPDPGQPNQSGPATSPFTAPALTISLRLDSDLDHGVWIRIWIKESQIKAYSSGSLSGTI
jgi:hypothetical protein